jgi:xylitol oxidase
VVPREHAPEAVSAVSKLGFDDVLQVCELRTIAADELWLSPFYGRDSLGLHFTWADDDDRVAAAVARVEAALAPFDARPHWGKVFQSDPRAHYPLLPRFRNLIDKHDPEHKFGNAFLDRFVY